LKTFIGASILSTLGTYDGILSVTGDSTFLRARPGNADPFGLMDLWRCVETWRMELKGL
jgi:hypothetical protein